MLPIFFLVIFVLLLPSTNTENMNYIEEWEYWEEDVKLESGYYNQILKRHLHEENFLYHNTHLI